MSLLYLLVESSLCVPFPCYSIVWGNQLHPHCVVCGSPVPCAPGSKTQSSPTKYKQVQTFWNNKSSKYDFYFNMIIVAHVLPGWMTQESAKPLERELESCLAWRSKVGAACCCVTCLDQAWEQIILSASLGFSWEKSLHCCQVFIPEWASLFALLLVRGLGLGVKQEATQMWHSCCCGVKGLYIKHKPSVAVMIIWEAVELPCLNPGLYYLASFGCCLLSLSLVAFILYLM